MPSFKGSPTIKVRRSHAHFDELSVDTLEISANGLNRFFTLGRPSHESGPLDKIGVYETKANEGVYQRWEALLNQRVKTFSMKPVLPESVVLEIGIAGGETLRWSREPADKVGILIHEELEKSAKLIKTHPKQEMALECRAEGKKAFCLLRNTGNEELRTVSPVDVPDGILCEDEKGKRHHLTRDGLDPDPKKVFPVSLTIAPTKTHPISFSLNECRNPKAVAIRTASLLTNPKYAEGYLLGNLAAKIEKSPAK